MDSSFTQKQNMKKPTQKRYFGTTFVDLLRFDSDGQKIILWQTLITANEKIKSSNFYILMSFIISMTGLLSCFLFQFLDRKAKKMGKTLIFVFYFKK